MATPDRSTAAAVPRYLTGELLAGSMALQWSGLYARRWRALLTTLFHRDPNAQRPRIPALMNSSYLDDLRTLKATFNPGNEAPVIAQRLGRPAARDGHVDVFTGEGVGEGLAYLAESHNCIFHNVFPISC